MGRDQDNTHYESAKSNKKAPVKKNYIESDVKSKQNR